MPSTVPQAVIDEVASTIGVIDSAIVAFGGIGTLLATAVEAALANGATEAQLVPVTEAVAAIAAKRQALAEAIATVPGGGPLMARGKKP